MCDINTERAEAAGRRFGVPWFPDAPTMLERVRPDICSITTGGYEYSSDHYEPAIQALEAGAHILCEKPMCISLKEADQIAAAVKKSGVTYMSAHNQLFLPVVQEAKRMIGGGELGRIIWLRSQDCFQAGVAGFKGKWRAKRKFQGGGELIDTGYHPTYRLLHLAGAPVAAVRGSMGRLSRRCV